MGLRDRLQQTSGVIIVVMLLAASLAVIVWHLPGILPRKPGRVASLNYFYDPANRRLFVDDNVRLAPLLKEGHFRAYVFSCSGCQDQTTHIVGWLEKYSDDAQRAIAEINPTAFSSDMNPELVRTIERGRTVAAMPVGEAAPQWIPAGGEAAAAMVQSIQTRCSQNRPPHQCLP